MNQQKQNTILIVETKDGAKYQGLYESKDTQKQIIVLANVTKTFQDKKELIPKKEITKDEIASINIIEYRPPKDEIHNINEIPENKKNVIDENKLANIEKAYDKSKDDFFDQLKPMSNIEAKKESRTYNQKNKDTFSLPENYNNNDNKRGWRGRGNRGYGRGRGRGRGGYNRGNRGGFKNFYRKDNENENNNGGYGNFRGRGRDRGRGKPNRGRYKNNYHNSRKDDRNNNIQNQNE